MPSLTPAGAQGILTFARRLKQKNNVKMNVHPVLLDIFIMVELLYEDLDRLSISALKHLSQSQSMDRLQQYFETVPKCYIFLTFSSNPPPPCFLSNPPPHFLPYSEVHQGDVSFL